MDVCKIDLKYYLDNGAHIPPETWFRMFNGWIPETADEVLVDVADYSHVYSGPVTVLVGHEANYSIDNSNLRPGLLYARKRPSGGTLFQSLRAAFTAAVNACVRLEGDPLAAGGLRFRADEFRLVLNDRLMAPNTGETMDALRPDLERLLRWLYSGAALTMQRDPDPKKRLTLDIRVEGEWSLAAVQKNLGTPV